MLFKREKKSFVLIRFQDKIIPKLLDFGIIRGWILFFTVMPELLLCKVKFNSKNLETILYCSLVARENILEGLTARDIYFKTSIMLCAIHEENFVNN